MTVVVVKMVVVQFVLVLRLVVLATLKKKNYLTVEVIMHIRLHSWHASVSKQIAAESEQSAGKQLKFFTLS